MAAARALALKLGADPYRAAIAGLLHDCMREELPEKLISICEENNMPITDMERRVPIILHAWAGAAEARKLLGYEDREIEEAIACHTTGRENMGLLAKIIFVADAIEPERNYEAAKEARLMLKMRKKPNSDADIQVLDKTILFLLDSQIKHIVETSRTLHPDSVSTRNWMIREIAKNLV
jgi:predicted HD superfamily hydrolase involved in NAD metabolism